MVDLSATGLGLIDYAIFFAALVAVLVVGVTAGEKVKNLEDYATSRGHRFSMPVLAMTLIVTAIGSNSSIGAISEIYNNGIIYVAQHMLALIGTFLVIQYAAHFMAARYSGNFSLYGILEREYGEVPAKISAGISVFLSLIYLSMQIIGMGYITKTFLGIPFILGASISTVVFVAYSSISGIRGVVHTDVLQFFIILVVFPILVGIVIYNMGGLQSVLVTVPKSKTLVFDHPNFTEYMYLALFWMMPFGLLRATFIQRFLMCKSGKELRQMGLNYVLFDIIFFAMIALIALASVNLLPTGITGKEVIPAIMKGFLPIGLKGLAITAFFAVIMSTADSELHAAAVLVTEMGLNKKEKEQQPKKRSHDIDGTIQNNDNKEARQVLWLRVSTLCLGFAALALALIDFSFIKVLTIASAFAFSAVNIPIFFAPFKDKRKAAVKAYLGSAISGLSAFVVLWLMLGNERIYMVSFYTTFFAIAGWFIGANFFDKIKTNFWARMWEAYKPSFNARPLLDSAQGHSYFMVLGIVTFLLRYISNTWQPFTPGNFIISIALLISCLLLLSLYFGDKIKANSYKLFIALWLAALFMVLPMYNMIAVLQYPNSMIEVVGLIMSVLILNLILSWRLAALMLLAAFGISMYINEKFYHHEAVFASFEYLNLAIYVTISGVIITMILKKVYDNVAIQKLAYADAMACSIAHELKSPISHSGILLKAHKVRTMEDVESLFQKMDKVQRSTSDVISRTVQLFTQGTSDRIVDEDVNVANLLMMAMVGTNYPRKDRERMVINVESDFVVRAYPNNLFTIVKNLVLNAYKYALKAKASATLEIYSKGNQLIFRDTGPGISSDRLLTIFDKGVTYNPTGTGFGLYYCKIEMERLGGSISCESKEGEYTQFTLTFPKRLKIKKSAIKGEIEKESNHIKSPTKLDK
jgi:Na+/proline symporter/signal transduction histidine kinase